MVWILIMLSYRGGIATAEFYDQAHCETARAAVVREYADMGTVRGNFRAVCVKR